MRIRVVLIIAISADRPLSPHAAGRQNVRSRPITAVCISLYNQLHLTRNYGFQTAYILPAYENVPRARISRHHLCWAHNAM